MTEAIQRYECVDGKSSKFWEISRRDADLTVRFGRIGTQGQAQTKQFSSADAAERERVRLIAEKARKGYLQVCAPQAPQIAVAADSGRPQPVRVPESSFDAACGNATTTGGSGVVADSTPIAPESLSWPSSGYQWADEVEKLITPLRGVHVPPFDVAAALAMPAPTFDGGRHPYWVDVISQALGRPLVAWTREQACALVVEENLARFERTWWREALLQALCDSARYVDWLVRQGLARHGVVALTELCLECAPLAGPLVTMRTALDVIRLALAAADEDTHATALRAAEQMPWNSRAHLQARAFVFPFHAAFFEIARQAGGKPEHFLMLSCATTPEIMTAYWRETGFDAYAGEHVALPVQLKLHGEAALPLLIALFERADDEASAAKLVVHARRLRTPGLFAGLMTRIDLKPVRGLLESMAGEHGDAVLYCAFRVMPRARSRLLETWALRLASLHAGAKRRALAALSGAERRAFDEIEAPYIGNDVDASVLPEILRAPPWLDKRRPAAPPTLGIAVPAQRTDLDHDEIKRRVAHGSGDFGRWRSRSVSQAAAWGVTPAYALLATVGVRPQLIPEVLAGRAVSEQDFQRSVFGVEIATLLGLEDSLVARFWNELPVEAWSADLDQDQSLAELAATIGAEIVPGLLRYCSHRPGPGWRGAELIDSLTIARAAVRAWRRTRRSRPGALAWIMRYPRTAALAALEVAFGTDAARRDDGQATLRWLLDNGHAAALDSAASECGDEAVAALETLKATDPIHILPNRLPKLAAFVAPEAMHRPRLCAGGTLPADAAKAVAMMLAISTPDAPYAGLDIVRETCTSDSLAEFAWDLFEGWLAHGALPSHAWAFQSLAVLGDDETARRLTPLIRRWPGESAKARAVAGLDVLSSIGTDLALMHLNAFATRAQFKALRSGALERIDAIALARGLTRDQLADRLVPDLDIESGVLVLDFGPRQFNVAFDEVLEPVVRDAAGTRLRTLPRVTKADDPDLAAAASERFKRLKKDAKAIAGQQIARLEQAMVCQRRWNTGEFHQFFIDHPVMRHLAMRLCWAAYGGAMPEPFRIAEDLSLADSHDSRFTLPEDAMVGIVHRLELSDDALARLGQLFADYEIVQPFPQFGRELYELSDQELATNTITRFESRKVAGGSILGLRSRGWVAGASIDAGFVSSFEKVVGQTVVEATIEPGMQFGGGDVGAPQRITQVVLRRPGTWGREGILPLSSLPPIVACEVLRDLDRMAAL